jgi:hypothetical protein
VSFEWRVSEVGDGRAAADEFRVAVLGEDLRGERRGVRWLRPASKHDGEQRSPATCGKRKRRVSCGGDRREGE